MHQEPGQQRSGTVALDLAKVELALRRKGLTWTSEKPGCDVSRATWHRLKTGKRISAASASCIASFLGFDVAELLTPDETGDEIQFAWPEHPEWEIVEGHAPWERTSNGLYFFRCKVRHRHVGDSTRPQFGRGRVYDLTRVADEERRTMREQLTRHAAVCRELAHFPQLIANLSVAPVAGQAIWWVVDEWIEGTTMSEVMSKGPVALNRLRPLMLQVANGLDALHSHAIVLRELSPERLHVDCDDQVRLTELDLAKLLHGNKTVSADWPADPYRAPEIESGSATPQADYFSWAMIYLHAATGDSTLVAHDCNALDAIAEQAEVKDLLRKCLSPMHSKRPRSVTDLLSVLE